MLTSDKPTELNGPKLNGIVSVPKSTQLRHLLAKKVESLKPGDPFFSIRDICHQYNVSVYTAKAALNYFIESGMLEHRQGSGTYRTNPINHGMSCIGIVAGHDFDPFTNAYYGLVTKGLLNKVHSQNRSAILIGQVSELPLDNLLDYLRSQRIAGLVLMGTFDEGFLKLIKTMNFPAVLSDVPTFNIGLDYVYVEEDKKSIEMVQYLIDLGHRNIGFLGYPEVNNIREEGYWYCMKKNGIKVKDRWIYRMTKGDYWYGVEAAREFYASNPEVTAVFCKNDLTAVGFVIGLQNMGKKVPDDISVVGFDGLPISEMANPPITTVKVNMTEMGEKMCDILMNRITNPNREPVKCKLDCEIVKRASCRGINF